MNPDSKPLGYNELVSAKAVSYTYLMAHSRNSDINEEAYLGFEETLHTKVEKWAKGTKKLTVHMSTLQGFMQAIVEDINNDYYLVAGAIFLVGLYTICFLGNLSPMHCRCVVALVGLLCVILSYTSGFGLMYLCGAESTGVH